ncbi:dsRBD fold-containing protein [Streptomyces sp. PAN_FS17]|uniref:dsRBD fold-containing protein n=1 Tax=Streptomyces sp. PAN_FS17 TaxID=1855351 RepID=UPI00089CBFEB|nr:dsRBD fold-containing protein [Streptomyces sp. PAN_FS17]SEE05892.1 protein of unknown function [Streptomyces sp. PAN_FS17]
MHNEARPDPIGPYRREEESNAACNGMEGRCNPTDMNVPEIGDELAASRAMNDLAQQLLRVAERDIEDVGASRPDTRQPAEWPM